MKFDFVIIGAGSAGCALAHRLAEDGKHTVALIEAGPKDRNPWIHIPVGYFRTLNNPRADWGYVTQPDPNMANRQIPWPRGRVLGGSSSINGLLYVRGQTQDYDHWRQLGNEGWGWDDVLPLFKRAENWTGAPKSELRGAGGPLEVSETRLSREIVDHWVDAAENAGFARNPDYNGADQEGVGYYQLTMKDGQRWSSAKAYLKPARSWPNLTVITGAQTKRLEVENGRVIRVHTSRTDEAKTIEVGKEAILSAGAIGSPQILMLSGIGAAEDLQEHGITVQHNLPGVGKNLQDHLQARPIYKTKLSTINVEVNSIFKQAKIALEYMMRRTGPMTMAASLGVAFLKTDPRLETPDIQFHIQPFSSDRVVEGTHPFSAFTASVLQLRPESRGHLALKSADYRDHPNIHPNYLSDPLDQDTIVKGIQVARTIAGHAPLAQYITEEFRPGKEVAFDDQDATLQWARETAVTIYHPTGTCKMGKDKTAVVDPRLKVHGLENLRVADASIMPMIVSGNTNAPAIMIGEKCADLIKEDVRV